MPSSMTPTKAAMLAGLAAMAVALPFSANAGEPLRLDTAQLDAVTAGALLTGFTAFGESAAFGPVSSFSTTNLNASSNTSPTFATASGSVSSFGLALGKGSTANADTTVFATQGDNVIVKPFNASGSGANYAYDYSYTYVYAFSSEWAF